MTGHDLGPVREKRFIFCKPFWSTSVVEQFRRVMEGEEEGDSFFVVVALFTFISCFEATSSHAKETPAKMGR